MAGRTSTSNLGLTGIPLFIAIELMLYGRGEQSHIEKMDHLEKAYGWLRAYLPALYERRPDEYTKQRIPAEQGALSLSDVMQELAIEVNHMYEKYDPIFEGKSCNQSEKEFTEVSRGVLERIQLIVAFSGIADKMSTTEDVFF